MCSAIIVSDYVNTIYIRNIYVSNLKIKLFISFLILIFTAWQIGIIGSSVDNSSEGGFGLAHFNFSNFFNPMYINSPFIPSFCPTEFDYEGFSYLGLGIILLFFVVLVNMLICNDISIFNKKYFLLCSSLSFLLLFSAGSVFSFYKYNINLFEGDSVDILRMFRANGRFIWPVYYSVTIYIIVLFSKIFRNKKTNLKYLIVIICFLLNTYENNDYITKINISLNKDKNIHLELNFDKKIWCKLSNEYNIVRLLNRSGVHPNNWEKISYIASMNHMGTNAAYLARLDNNALEVQNNIDMETLRNGIFDKKTIYVFDRKDNPLVSELIKRKNIVVTSIDGLSIILPNGEGILNRLGLHLFTPDNEYIQINHDYTLSNLSNRPIFLHSGWSTPEYSGVWSDGNRAKILVSTNIKLDRIKLNLSTFQSSHSSNQNIILLCNGLEIIKLELSKNEEITIDLSKVPFNGFYYDLDFLFINAESPKKFLKNADRRKLSILLKKIRFENDEMKSHLKTIT